MAQLPNDGGSPPGLFKTPSAGPMVWQEADSLLEETPVHSAALEMDSNYPTGDVRRAKINMYGSHFLSTWGQRAWEFLVGLVMLDIHPSSLLLVSIFGLCDAAAVVIFGPTIGSFVDSTPRLRAACTMYIAQNVFVAISAAACLALVLQWGTAAGAASIAATPLPHSTSYWVLVTLAIVAGSLSSVGAVGATLSVEREWTKALSGSNSDSLAAMNAVMKRIDLTCLIASPIGVGLLMSWRVDAAIIAVLVWNIAAWVPECTLLKRAQAASPALAAPKGALPFQPQVNRALGGEFSAGDSATGNFVGLSAKYDTKRFNFFNLRLLERCRRQAVGWSAYAQQPAAPAAFALALLYLTVMSFGTLMTAWLKWVGMSETELSIYRGAGALSGIAATVAFPPLQARWGLVRTGAAAIWAQLLCLVVASTPAIVTGIINLVTATPASSAAAVTAGPSFVVARVLVIGLVLSRFGLWGFDLAVNQMLQETVSPASLGTVTGVQGSLQSLFQMCAYAAGVVVWQPSRFVFLMAGSVGVVSFAAIVFLGYALKGGCSHLTAASQTPHPLTP